MEQALQDHPQAGVAVSDADIVDASSIPSADACGSHSDLQLSQRFARRLLEAKAFDPWLPALGNCMAFLPKLKTLLMPFPDGRGPFSGVHCLVDRLLWSHWPCTSADAFDAYRKHDTNMSGGAIPFFTDRLRAYWKARHQRDTPTFGYLIPRIGEPLRPAS